MKRVYDELFEHDLIAQAVERGVEESGRVKGIDDEATSSGHSGKTLVASS